jgi:hypothetical protein
MPARKKVYRKLSNSMRIQMGQDEPSVKSSKQGIGLGKRIEAKGTSVKQVLVRLS